MKNCPYVTLKQLTLITFKGRRNKELPLRLFHLNLSLCLFNSCFHEPLSPTSPIAVKQLFVLRDNRLRLITDASLIKGKLWEDGIDDDMTAQTPHPYPLLLAV